MKINKKIIYSIFMFIILINTVVYANYSYFYTERLSIVVSNISDTIEKIEIISTENKKPDEVFESIDTVNIDGRDANLYKVKEYNKNKFIMCKLDNSKDYDVIDGSGLYHRVYYDSNKNKFSFYEIKTVNEIDDFKINSGKFELVIKDLNLYSNREKSISNLFLRFYTNKGDYKDIAIGTNSYATTDQGLFSNIKRIFDYQSGEVIKSERMYKFSSLSIRIIIQICVAMMATIIIELLYARENLIDADELIIKTNIITQLGFHFVFLVPETYWGVSIVSVFFEIFENISEKLRWNRNLV